ncbi:MAG: hypothetical protein E6K78_00680 [Candidatus Eisenbacteria bacterium]|uniref:Glycosyltransferase RgtA/B/C/D-like domain-containing protein n=1 Tax=Eiseniibacteriota bacterium TaxID=2212470 RepID=A0A538TY08_UNCEI|nr:MAG: hypothetical protein E6K78_00680 [Candidatus Eisenbacteria bacterium]
MPIVLGVLALFLATQYGRALSLPFISDDYVILEKTSRSSFLRLWSTSDLLFGWYRPWSRELHYWVLQRLVGLRPLLYHLTSFGLWLAVMALYAVLVRDLRGLRVSLVATAAVAAAAAWGAPLLWVASAQELWMLLFSLLALLAFHRGRPAWSTAFVALALLSKETAAGLPALALAHAWWIKRRPLARAFLESAPWWGGLGVWAAAHPVLGERLFHPEFGIAERASRPATLLLWGKTMLAWVNLETWPRPSGGWPNALLAGLPGVVLLGGLAAFGASLASPPRTEPERPGDAKRRPNPVAFATAWAIVGSLPLIVPSIGWHSYYGLWGALGAWMALAGLVAARRALAIGLVAALALLRSVFAETPSWDRSTEIFQLRAAFFMRLMSESLADLYPRLPSHARLYFARVPRDVGFTAGNGFALRLWYRDSTLRAGYYSEYEPRRRDEPAGRDYFFRYDSVRTWVEVVHGAEDVASGRAANPRWEGDHRDLARLLGMKADWSGAASEFAKLAAAAPANPEYAVNLAYCLERGGDSLAAALWFARADSLRNTTSQRKSARAP